MVNSFCKISISLIAKQSIILSNLTYNTLEELINIVTYEPLEDTINEIYFNLVGITAGIEITSTTTEEEDEESSGQREANRIFTKSNMTSIFMGILAFIFFIICISSLFWVYTTRNMVKKKIETITMEVMYKNKLINFWAFLNTNTNQECNQTI